MLMARTFWASNDCYRRRQQQAQKKNKAITTGVGYLSNGDGKCLSPGRGTAFSNKPTKITIVNVFL